MLLRERGVAVIEILVEEAHHRLFKVKDGAKVEELQKKVALVFLFEQGQLLNAPFCLALLMCDVVIDALVAHDGSRVERFGKHKAFERAAAAQGNIDLSRRKTLVGIDDCAVEGEALTLVYRDGPSQTQGQLLERSLHLRLYFPRLFVQGVARVLPLQRLHIDGFRVALTIDAQLPVACLHHTSDASVVVTMLAGRVVLHEHHLRPFL